MAIPALLRHPATILACGGIILILSLGTRHSFGLFLVPMTQDLGWGRADFALAIALQNLLWGIMQPIVGMVSDKYGAGRILATGAVSYVAGLLLMAQATTIYHLLLTAGLLIGLGLSCTTFSIVNSVIGRAFDDRHRSLALGIAAALGSAGQFLMLPYGQALISHYGWQSSLLILALSVALIAPLAAFMRVPERSAAGFRLTLKQALQEAGRHKGFWLLIAGFGVCGFQVVFIATHFPAYLLDQGLSSRDGMIALALIGFFNIIGSYGCGWLGGIYRKKIILAWLYLLRAGVLVAFLVVPVTPYTVYAFAALMGLLWLGTVPLTTGLVAQIFGVQFIATLFGIVFLGHQVGAFLGAWLGGYLYDLAGSYQPLWLMSILLSLVAALLHWPVDDQRIIRASGRETAEVAP